MTNKRFASENTVYGTIEGVSQVLATHVAKNNWKYIFPFFTFHVNSMAFARHII